MAKELPIAIINKFKNEFPDDFDVKDGKLHCVHCQKGVSFVRVNVLSIVYMHVTAIAYYTRISVSCQIDTSVGICH